MKFVYIALIVFLVVSLAPLSNAAAICGSTCPAQCSEAGEVCTTEERAGSASNVRGTELSCVQRQNVGCSVKLGWPFIAGNECPSGLEHDASTDGPEDCGFLGLGAVFGGATKYCHASQQVTCSASALCPAGFTVESTRSCNVQSASTTTLECCQLTLSPPVNDLADRDEEDEVDPVPGGVTYISVRPSIATVGPNQTLQFAAVGLTNAGVEVPITQASWRVNNDKGRVNTTGAFTSCTNCTGSIAVYAVVGPLSGSADVEIVNIADYHIEPASASIALNALGFFVATGRNGLGGEVVNVSSAWSTDVGQLRSSGETPYAFLLGSAIGSGRLTATTLGLRASSAVSILQSGGATSVLLAHPSPITLFEGDQQEIVVFARDANGVFVALPTDLHFDIRDASIAAFISGENKVRGLHVGSTTLTISAGAISLQVPVTVRACRAGTTVQCSAEDSWDVAAHGAGIKTCSETPSGTAWGACVDQDSCDGASPARASPTSDGIACPAFCSDPSVDDPDCSCSAGQTRACTEVASGCWGVMTCSAENRFGLCVPSALCIGRAVDIGVEGAFNGFICASTSAVPSPLSLEVVSSCPRFGEAFVRGVVSPDECSRTESYTLSFDTEARLPVDAVVAIEREALGGWTAYTLNDVASERVLLNVTDSTGVEVIQPMSVDQVLRFNTEVKLRSISIVEGETTVHATFDFTYDSCVRQLSQAAVPR